MGNLLPKLSELILFTDKFVFIDFDLIDQVKVFLIPREARSHLGLLQQVCDQLSDFVEIQHRDQRLGDFTFDITDFSEILDEPFQIKLISQVILFENAILSEEV